MFRANCVDDVTAPRRFHGTETCGAYRNAVEHVPNPRPVKAIVAAITHVGASNDAASVDPAMPDAITADPTIEARRNPSAT
jgi:hypothetical protein